jgi:hypothetical protein
VIVWLLTGLTRAEWMGFIGCLIAASILYAVRGAIGKRSATVS